MNDMPCKPFNTQVQFINVNGIHLKFILLILNKVYEKSEYKANTNVRNQQIVCCEQLPEYKQNFVKHISH